MTLFVHTITMFAVLRVNKTTIATQKASAVLSSHQYSSEQRLKYWCYQPCFCLCLGFSQMIMMAPFLLMILHFSQMGFTEDLTFISKYTPFLKKSPYTIVTERFANCKHYFKENARFFKGFLCHFYIMAFCLRNARAECGCRRQHLPLARVCILPEGHFFFTGNPEGISRKEKTAASF